MDSAGTLKLYEFARSHGFVAGQPHKVYPAGQAGYVQNCLAFDDLK
jgi:hypothetical protein